LNISQASLRLFGTMNVAVMPMAIFHHIHSSLFSHCYSDAHTIVLAGKVSLILASQGTGPQHGPQQDSHIERARVTDSRTRDLLFFFFKENLAEGIQTTFNLFT
jgi:hypothetical protein